MKICQCLKKATCTLLIVAAFSIAASVARGVDIIASSKRDGIAAAACMHSKFRVARQLSIGQNLRQKRWHFGTGIFGMQRDRLGVEAATWPTLAARNLSAN